MRPDKYVRLKADPSKVRVSIVKSKNYGWQACVSARDRSWGFYAYAQCPREAVNLAMRWADESYRDGIDLECDYAYIHPFYDPKL